MTSCALARMSGWCLRATWRTRRATGGGRPCPVATWSSSVRRSGRWSVGCWEGATDGRAGSAGERWAFAFLGAQNKEVVRPTRFLPRVPFLVYCAIILNSLLAHPLKCGSLYKALSTCTALTTRICDVSSRCQHFRGDLVRCQPIGTCRSMDTSETAPF